MGRHRSTLRDLGWGVSNSPNPWKQGSAKRVVRTLDYSQAELDEVAVEPAVEPKSAAPQDHHFDERLHQLQQDGRNQLDRIREQFEAQDAENKRKLDRLNGRIAELGEGKRAMWSVLGQAQVPPKPLVDGRAGDGGEIGAAVNAATDASLQARGPPRAPAAAAPIRANERDAASRKACELPRAGEAELRDDGVRRELDMNVEAEMDSIEMREAVIAERDVAVSLREAAVREAETLVAATREQLAERERELNRKEEALAAREQQLSESQTRFDKKQQQPGTAGLGDTRNAVAGVMISAAAKSDEGGSTKGGEPTRSGADSTQQQWKSDLKQDASGDAKLDERTKVRFNEKSAAAVQSNALAAKPDQSKVEVTKVEATKVEATKMEATKAEATKAEATKVEATKAEAGKVEAAKQPLPAVKAKADADGREIQCDSTADWLRAENLTASLKRQCSENPDEVFYPLPSQRTCELTDIFSAPRRPERAKGSGEWTPASEEAVRLQQQPNAHKEKPLRTSQQTMLQILGVDGEYMGEQVAVPLQVGPSASAKTILLGRSSSCDVTLSRDDQISRRHLQIEARDGKLFARDLGSTYGTRINNKTLGAEAAELKVGDVLGLGASSFQLQAV